MKSTLASARGRAHAERVDDAPVGGPHALDGQRVEFTLDFSEGSLAETLAAIHAELEEGEAVRPVGEYVLISPSRGAYLTAETWLAGGARWLEAGAELQLALAPAVEVRDQLQQLRSPEVERDAKKKLVFNLKKRLTAPEFSEEFIAQDGLAAMTLLRSWSAWTRLWISRSWQHNKKAALEAQAL